MVTSLLKHDKIRTTDVKAKEIRRWADHVITLAKKGDLHARRQALAIVMEKNVVHKLFEEAGERFSGSAGGYTRIVKIGRRAGDAAPMSLIELVAKPSGKAEKKGVTAKEEKEKELKAPTAPAEKEAVHQSAKQENMETGVSGDIKASAEDLKADAGDAPIKND
jgi:large subunit ribosomal protein L17